MSIDNKEQEPVTEDQEQQNTEQPASDEPIEASGMETAEQAAEEQDAAFEQAEAEEVSPDAASFKKLAEENHNKYLRALADYDNLRRRTAKEKEDLAAYASAKLVTQLLPVLDNFQRALQSGGEAAEPTFGKGVDMIYRQFIQVLENEGLQAMEPVGQPFDPEMHQAIMQVESEEHPEGTVVESVQTGYKLKDKVLRPAMVKVSG